MSTNPNESPGIQAAAAATAEVQPITPEELIETIRALKARIPDFQQVPIPDAKSLRVIATLHAPFKTAAIAAVGASEIIERAVGFSMQELYTLNHDAELWSAAAEEIQGLAQGVVAANLKRRHRVGLASLMSYSMTRQLVRKDGESRSNLLPLLQTMKETSRLGRKRRRTPTTPEPVPAAQ